MIDIAHDEQTDDLVITSDGDFAFAECTKMHQKDLLLSEKGEWKESPGVGVGLFSFLDEDSSYDMLRAINMEFSKDGMKVREVKVEQNGITTDAYYE